MNLSMLTLSIFQGFEQKRAGWINLNECALALPEQPVVSQFLGPLFANDFLAAVHRKKNWGYSLTPYLEDRAHLWRGSYIKPPKTIHVAIDVNVPAGTAVSVAQPSRVVNIVTDPDQEGGWGTVVMFELKKPIGKISHFLYAHLSAGSVAVKPDDLVQPGTVVACIAKPFENGGWEYEHFHGQAFTRQKWATFQGDLFKEVDGKREVDGYDEFPDAVYDAAIGQILPLTIEHPDYPDPLPLLGPQPV